MTTAAIGCHDEWKSPQCNGPCDVTNPVRPMTSSVTSAGARGHELLRRASRAVAVDNCVAAHHASIAGLTPFVSYSALGSTFVIHSTST